MVEGRRVGWKALQTPLPNSNKSDSGMLHTHVPCTKLFLKDGFQYFEMFENYQYDRK